MLLFVASSVIRRTLILQRPVVLGRSTRYVRPKLLVVLPSIVYELNIEYTPPCNAVSIAKVTVEPFKLPLEVFCSDKPLGNTIVTLTASISASLTV